MSMRTFSVPFFTACLLIGCAPESGVPDGANIDCALEEGANFSKDCVLEVIEGDLFAIHHSDGASYRFRYDANSSAIMAAGGADIVHMAQANKGVSKIEFTAQGNVYRFDSALISSAAGKHD